MGIVKRHHFVLGVFEKEEAASLIMDLEWGKITQIVIDPEGIHINSIEVKK